MLGIGVCQSESLCEAKVCHLLSSASGLAWMKSIEMTDVYSQLSPSRQRKMLFGHLLSSSKYFGQPSRSLSGSAWQVPTLIS